MGGNHPAETTGKWVATSFEHDSARPVNGYAAPQLHTHVVFFNLTETKNGESRALQPHELYRSQQYATAIYRSELALRLKGQGYEIERGKSGQPEIAGYTREYLGCFESQKSANPGLPRTTRREEAQARRRSQRIRHETTNCRPSRTRKCRECTRKWPSDSEISRSR